MLIGLDQYWKFVKPEVVPVRDGLVALNTMFGWMISGSYDDVAEEEEQHQKKRSRTPRKTSVQLFCIEAVQDMDLKRIWDMDLATDEDETENPLIKRFEETIVHQEGRYEVSLPWKRYTGELLDNRRSAEQRLQSLTKKLAKDPGLKTRYEQAFLDMEKDGVVEEIPDNDLQTTNKIFYMPHRPVVKESSSSTKVRPVFDASAKGRNGISLNDCMETGPNLIPNLVDILVRFRKWPIALAADIQKAFLQIAVRTEDRDVHRFLLELDGKIRVMRFTRVPFGNRCSPFLLNATIKYHLKKFESSRVIEELAENLYVDDWLTGAEEEEDAAQMVIQADTVMSQASMNLTKWGSNNKEVLDSTLYSLTDKSENLSNVKVLGLGWSPSEDCFFFEGMRVEPGLVITKRTVLSLIARLFDPLGLLGPFVIGLKCLFQTLWKLGLDWDQEVPTDTATRVTLWIEDLSKLKTWKVERTYTSGRWDETCDVKLHAFGDASEGAYGACVYLIVKKKDGAKTSKLILSRSRVAPLKMVTLPRLELLGAVLAVQLVELVRKTLKLPKECCHCWTDSMVALGWIRDDPSRWKPFVANRVAQIQQIVSPSQWKHCPGEENPADLVTRGISADELMLSQKWLKGPERLLDETTLLDDSEETELCDIREELNSKSLIAVRTDDTQLLDVARWGKLEKAYRIMAWILRFVNNSRGARKSGDLAREELVQARTTLIGTVQRQELKQECEDLESGSTVSRRSRIHKLSPYMGEDGLLRVRGRLENTELTYEEKHPIIVPKGHFAVLLVRSQHLLLNHAGVNSMLTSLRDEYWIIGSRRIAKRVKKQCVACQRLDSLHLEAPMAPLPATRVKEARPFSVIGVDHAGPLYCADRRGKVYILLFTCAVVRAVHLELVNFLNLEEFIMAFRRFVARRGMPKVIWSDNAQTFKAACPRLVKTFGPLAPKWNYIVPRSPWWGGWWERLVRSVKSGLRKTLRTRSLTRAELEVTLYEIEACINSRPLTFVGDNLQDRVPLTPAHFLIGPSCVLREEDVDPEVDSEDLRNRLLVKNLTLDKFWEIWSKEYLRHLPQGRGKGGQPMLNVGDLVNIRG